MTPSDKILIANTLIEQRKIQTSKAEERGYHVTISPPGDICIHYIYETVRDNNPDPVSSHDDVDKYTDYTVGLNPFAKLSEIVDELIQAFEYIESKEILITKR
jgi:hypothetical protein